MHTLTSWFIRNPVAANLVMAFILISGLLSLWGMRIEGFPKLPPNTVTISTMFDNAHTEQVDQQITQKIEKALQGLDGVKKITSITFNGFSEIQVQKNDGHDLQKLLDDIRLRVDGLSSLPKAAEKPVINRNEFDYPALYIMVDGETDTKTLQSLARTLKKSLLERSEISRLRLLGEKDPEIHIEIHPMLLEKYDLTLSDISQKISENSLLFQSGTLKTKGAHISLRADSQAYYKTDFEAIPIIEHADGTRITLGDVAKIHDRYKDDDVIVRFNGRKSVGIELLVGRKENLLIIADTVRDVIEQIKPQFPADVHISTFGDSSSYISDRLDLLQSNAFQGLAIVIFLLALFLNTKLAFWVGMGIPVSIAGTLSVMGTSWIDYSLNDVTTFGMIIALGILVDDAVVVGESVFSERRRHSNPIAGTENGVKRVATATIFGVLTSVAAFSPMLMMQSELGKILGAFSGVVIFALLFSLFESKFILPAHLAHIDIDDTKPRRNVFSRLWQTCQNAAQNTLEGFRDNIYAPLVLKAITHRYAVIIMFLSIAVIGLGLIETGKVKSVFFPEVPGQIITIHMEMDARAPYNLTLHNMGKIEQIAKTLNEEYAANNAGIPPIQNILKVVTGAYKGEIYAELIPSENRPYLTTLDILKEWQNRVDILEGAISLEFSGTEEIGGGFEVQIFAHDETALRAVSEKVQKYLRSIKGVHNLRDGLKGGQPEIGFTLKPEAYHLGFTSQDFAVQIGNRFGGTEVQRFQRAGEEVKVILQNAQRSRQTLDHLMQTRLRNKDGKWFPLGAVADFNSLYSHDYIERRNGQRVNTIKAYIDKTVVSPSEIGQGLFQTLVPDLQKQYPSVQIKPAGELEEMGKMQGNLKRALIIACVLIYVLMAIPLKSYWQPFIIMSVVPFGFIGATLGHLIMDVPFSILSFFGMLALTGIVVNDSLVMMTRYNDARTQDKLDIHTALQSAGVGRFQAIFLTTVTTVAGLTPLMLETSEQAQYLIPATISLAYGEIFATAITLILIPVLIAVTEDIKVFTNRVVS